MSLLQNAGEGEGMGTATCSAWLPVPSVPMCAALAACVDTRLCCLASFTLCKTRRGCSAYSLRVCEPVAPLSCSGGLHFRLYSQREDVVAVLISRTMLVRCDSVVLVRRLDFVLEAITLAE